MLYAKSDAIIKSTPQLSAAFADLHNRLSDFWSQENKVNPKLSKQKKSNVVIDPLENQNAQSMYFENLLEDINMIATKKKLKDMEKKEKQGIIKKYEDLLKDINMDKILDETKKKVYTQQILK